MKNDSNKENVKRKVQSYAKYSGMAYQLIGLLFVTIWLGIKADEYMGNERKYITALASLLVLFAFFYKVYISVTRLPKNGK